MSEERNVPDELDGERLDRAVVKLFGGSRAIVRRAVDDGHVRINGRRSAKGSVVKAGDKVSVEQSIVPEDGPPVPNPELPLQVMYESDAVLVVNKPAHMATAPLRPDETNTLANALIAQYPELIGIGYRPREPGLLHRLDNDTSGLVVVARTTTAFDELANALKGDRIHKEYLVICTRSGLPEMGSIEHPICHHPKDRRRMYACVHPRDVARNAPKPASTAYQVEREAGDLALVRVSASRAARHQIRVHFASIEHPLVGDELYDGDLTRGMTRQALHAARVSYESRTPGMSFDVSSALPTDMTDLLATPTPSAS